VVVGWVDNGNKRAATRLSDWSSSLAPRLLASASAPTETEMVHIAASRTTSPSVTNEQKMPDSLSSPYIQSSVYFCSDSPIPTFVDTDA
jgi:hypothetical protein